MASSLVVTLGLNAVDWIRGLTKAEAQMQGLVTATAKQSAAIDRQIKSLERQAATVGMTTREIKLYELAQKGATTAQLAQAGAALKTVENFERIQKAARGLGLVLGTLGVGSITGVIALFSSIVKGIDDMDDLRDATGSTIANISALDDIFRRTMGSADSVGTLLIRMNKVLNDTEPGTKAANIIKGIGLEVEALKQLDPAEAARQMAVAFSKFADDGAKGRAFLELFAKTTKEIGPAMDELAKQTRLVGTVTNEQVEEAKKFRQELFAMEKNILDVARSLAGPLVTAINATSEAMKKAKEEGKGFFAQNFAGQKAFLGSLFGGGSSNEETERLKNVERLNGLLAKGNVTLDQRVRLTKQLSDLQAKAPSGLSQREAIFGGGQGSKASIGDFKDNEETKKKAAGIAKTVSEAQRYLETLQKQAEKTQELTVLEQTLLDIQKGRIEGLTPKLKEQILVAAQEADARKITTDLLKEEKLVREAVASMLEKAEAQAAAEIQAIASGNEALQLEIDMLGKDEVAKAALNNARLESVISIKEEELAFLELSNAVSALVSQRKAEIAELRKRQQLTTKKADVENFQKATDEAKKATDDVSEFTKEASRNIQDALGDTLLSTLKGDFASIGKMWSDLILKMIAQAAAARLNEALFGKNGSGGSIGPIIEGIAQLFGGGTGGGETGDFARMDRQSVGSREVASSMAKNQMGGQIVQNINIGDYATRNDVMNAMNAAKEQAKAEIFRSQRSRGQFATS